MISVFHKEGISRNDITFANLHIDHKILFVDKFGVELHQFHVFQTFYIDC
jgi:tRNA A-37 threonylcarbamoyl transferase component Bud32